MQDKEFARIGPKWNGLFGSERTFVGPDRKKGELAMPSYDGVVTKEQLDSLVPCIQSLK